MTIQRLKSAAFFLAVFLATFAPAKAAKFDFYAGAFDFSAETNSDEGSVSGLGAYKLSYYLPLFENFEAGLGYTLILSDTVSGDAAFGLDIEAAYYPFTSSSPLTFQTDKVYAKYESLWKPFVLLGYHARQFQSVSTQYTGFGLGVGVERALKHKFNLKSLVRYASLVGASDGEATELVILVGLTFNF